MIKQALLLVLLFFVSLAEIFAQTLSPKVQAMASGQKAYSNFDFSQTIGQTAVEIIGSSGYVLTQGFQQPHITIENNFIPQGNGVEVYPNPATNFIKVKLFGDIARNFRIEIININGTIVNTVKLKFVTSFYYIEQIPVSDMKIGFYFVRVTSEDRLISRTFKIEKL